jgi:hypothetical protein
MGMKEILGEMPQKRSLTNIEKYWKKRKKSRLSFDKDRASMPFLEKAEIAERLRADD